MEPMRFVVLCYILRIWLIEDLDPTKYRENRMAALKKLSDPYPHKWDVNISIPSLIEKYKDIESSTHLESELLACV